MQTNKILIGGIVGGIAFFLLGWVLYGMLMMDYLMSQAGTATGVHKEPMEMGILFAGNLCLGFLFAIILCMNANPPSIMDGLKQGAVVGLLMSLGSNLVSYSMTNLMTMNGLLADVATFTVMTALGSAIIAWAMGMSKKSS